MYPYFESARPLITAEGLSYVDDDVARSTHADAAPGSIPTTDGSSNAPSRDLTTGSESNAVPANTRKPMKTIEFNHGLAETIQALINSGLRITLVQEYDSVPWNALRGRMEKAELGEYRLLHGRERVPLTYTILAVKE